MNFGRGAAVGQDLIPPFGGYGHGAGLFTDPEWRRFPKYPPFTMVAFRSRGGRNEEEEPLLLLLLVVVVAAGRASGQATT